jgi:cellulase/cellobiase CelA1
MFVAMAGLERYLRRWRSALHVAVSAVMVVVLGLASTATAHAAAVTATLAVTSTWQTGFIARFAITNWSAVPLSDWKLEFDLPPGESISHSWNSSFARYGTHYVLTPANWNRIIAPGGSATGGFRGVLTGAYSPPLNCTFNRQVRCS